MNTMLAKETLAAVVERRYSCRTYDGRLLQPAHHNGLEQFIAGLAEAPFGSPSHFTIIAAREGDTNALRGLGTYGMIKRPAGFIVGAMGEGPFNHEDFGYRLESLVLGATALGLDTCWLGGSFTGSTFTQRMGLSKHESVPAVIAMGYRAEKMRTFERIARWKRDSDGRKPWSDLFFDGEPGRPLAREGAGTAAAALDLLRLAPSAMNYQPWRVIKNEKEDAYRFYLSRTKNYNEKSFLIKSDIQRIDMGIAMAHFDLAVSELSLPGSWELEEDLHGRTDAGLEYVATWRG